MLVAGLLIFSFHLCESKKIQIPELNIELSSCVENIISHWFKKGSDITYVDLSFQDNEIIKTVHDMAHVTVTSRTAERRLLHHNEAYIIMIDNYSTFKNEFMLLKRERDWRPNVYFLIVFKEIDENLLDDVFKDLLHDHIFDVVVIKASNNARVYSYNPFENYGCGNFFDKILTYGKCSVANVSDFYFYKFKTGLEGCTLNAEVSHWPPYIINPEMGDDMVQIVGTEQYAMQILSELDGFSVNYTYTDDAEEFAIIDHNMIASNPLGFIQKGHIDTVFGGMLLNFNRAQAFNYIYIHPAFSDQLGVLVKKAGPIMTWRNMYLEFAPNVWILLLVTFVIFFAIFVFLFRKDKCKIFLIMWNIFFQHGCNLRYKMNIKCFIFQWVVFAFLINIYYQSNLMGLTTRVSHNYQISELKHINQFHMQPCVSTIIKQFLKIVTQIKLNDKVNKRCDTLLSSVEVVSKDDTKYTVVLHTIYEYNKLKFSDEFGDPLMFLFKKPISKIMNAVFFYKGFPMLEKLQSQALRMHENGLLDKHMRNLYYEKARKVIFVNKEFQARFINCWYILFIGIGIATVVIVIEFLTNRYKKR